MAKRLETLKKGTCYHGNAGMASAFAALADRKLKPGGVLALVLPLSIANGLAWSGFRKMIIRGYSDVAVLSIAANNRDMSFSSDTGMAECLVIGRKLKPEEVRQGRARFTSLRRRPQGFVHASTSVGQLLDGSRVRRIEDGPFGATPLTVGDELAGGTIDTPFNEEGESWSAVRLLDYSLAQTAYTLTQSKLWLPGNPCSIPLNMASLSQLGSLGTYHLDVVGPRPRGPFDRATPSPTATYPALWNHNATKETKLICEPDSQLLVRPGLEGKAADVWSTASRAHLNLDFTFGSQPLAIAFTDPASIGGSVWGDVRFSDGRFDYLLALWGNSTLGLLMYWWHSSRQQSSKARLTIRIADSLPVLDFRTLDTTQLRKAEQIFKAFRDRELKPAYLADADPNRALLDQHVVCGLLGFDKEVYRAVRRVAAKWCAEPSVHGGKSRPKDAALVV